MNRHIKKVAVLGSGIMGSRIACHLAGAGLQVLLLDMIGKDQEASALPKERNKLVNDALQTALKSNPSPVYHAGVIQKISTGNFTDDFRLRLDY
jgi:3-hydroxyacyl-CoA dehydrogenase